MEFEPLGRGDRWWDRFESGGRRLLIRRATTPTIMILGVVVLVNAWRHFDPPAPISLSLANGKYNSRCCGSITLNDGLAAFNGGHIRYRLIAPKDQLYVDPEQGLHVADGNHVIAVAGDSSYIKLSSNPRHGRIIDFFRTRLVAPDSLVLFDNRETTEYYFTRSPPIHR